MKNITKIIESTDKQTHKDKCSKNAEHQEHQKRKKNIENEEHQDKS